MPTFELTPEQIAVISEDLDKAESGEGVGTVFAQVFKTTMGNTVCRCHFVDQEMSQRVRFVLAGNV